MNQELTFIIKQDIANVNKQIASLQSYVKNRSAQGGSKSPEAKQIDEHHHNVVMLLQSKLADTSMSFKDVLVDDNSDGDVGYGYGKSASQSQVRHRDCSPFGNVVPTLSFSAFLIRLSLSPFLDFH